MDRSCPCSHLSRPFHYTPLDYLSILWSTRQTLLSYLRQLHQLLSFKFFPSLYIGFRTNTQPHLISTNFTSNLLHLLLYRSLSVLWSLSFIPLYFTHGGLPSKVRRAPSIFVFVQVGSPFSLRVTSFHIIHYDIGISYELSIIRRHPSLTCFSISSSRTLAGHSIC